MEAQPGDGVSRSLQLDVYRALTNDISLLHVGIDAMLTARLCQVQQPLLSNCNVDWSLVNPVYKRLSRLPINRLQFGLDLLQSFNNGLCISSTRTRGAPLCCYCCFEINRIANGRGCSTFTLE
jgi:hypothetical protein